MLRQKVPQSVRRNRRILGKKFFDCLNVVPTNGRKIPISAAVLNILNEDIVGGTQVKRCLSGTVKRIVGFVSDVANVQFAIVVFFILLIFSVQELQQFLLVVEKTINQGNVAGKHRAVLLLYIFHKVQSLRRGALGERGARARRK